VFLEKFAFLSELKQQIFLRPRILNDQASFLSQLNIFTAESAEDAERKGEVLSVKRIADRKGYFCQVKS